MATFNFGGYNYGAGDWTKYLQPEAPLDYPGINDFPGAKNLQIAPDQPTPSPSAGPSADQITQAYSQYLGRNPGTQGGNFGAETAWEAGDPNWLATIQNSPEAQAYKRQTFTDPASSAWEKLLNARIQQLQQPYQNPAFDQTVNQLNAYLARLNGPAYTNDQMGLLQTQALDPLERQRQATRQQILQRAASRGLDPKSGIVEKELQDADQQFNALRTKTQAGFASGAIGLGNQNAGMAAQIAPLISKLYQDQFNSEEQRRNQAASLAGVVPQEAWQRLIGANGTINQTNPLQTLQLLNGFQTQGYNQNADFSGGLTQLLALLLGS